MDKLRSAFRWLDARRDRCFDLVRIYLGIGLLVKGALFASDPELLPTLLEDSRSFTLGAAVVAQYVVLAHLCGGLLLALGLFTRIAAIVQLPALLGAVFVVHRQEGFFTPEQNLEFSLLVLFLLVLAFLHGPGEWSLDRCLAESRGLTVDEQVGKQAH